MHTDKYRFSKSFLPKRSRIRLPVVGQLIPTDFNICAHLW